MKMAKLREGLSMLKYNKKNIITFCILAFLIILGCVLYSLRYNIMYMNSGDSEATPIYSLDASKQNTVYSYNDKAVIVNNETVTCVDSKGNKKFELTAKTSSPIVKICEDYILVADRGGSEVYVIHKGEMAQNYSAENEIVNCSINKKGRVVLVTKETSYRNVIIAYNNRGEELYKWKISDYYITDAVMSQDGSRIAATYISTDNEQLKGGVVMVNVRKEKVLGKVAYEDCVFPYVSFNGDNTATAIGDTMMVGVDKNGGEKWKVDYQDKKLQTFGFREGDGSILAFANNANNTTLIAYDKNGKEKGSTRLDFSVNNVDMRSGLSIAVGDGKAAAVDKKCTLRLSLDLGQEFKAGWFKEDKKMIYLVNGSNVEIIKL